jgi:hypothetical protein
LHEKVGDMLFSEENDSYVFRGIPGLKMEFLFDLLIPISMLGALKAWVIQLSEPACKESKHLARVSDSLHGSLRLYDYLPVSEMPNNL